jgi:hypothetical protein
MQPRGAELNQARLLLRPALARAAWVKAACRHLTPHWGFWLATLAVAALDGAWLALSPRLRLPPWFPFAVLVFAVTVAAALALRQLRDATFDRWLAAAFRVLMFTSFAVALNFSVQTLNCLLMSLNWPLADPALLAADRALGFDWNAYAMWVGAQEWLRPGLQFAYSNLVYKALPVLVAVFAVLGRDDRIDELAFLSIGAALVCIAIAAMVPAHAAWVTLASPEAVAAYGGIPYPGWLPQFTALRGTAPMVIDPTVMGGLATFPSFHTCLGLILLWCSRGHWLTQAAGAAGGAAVIAATPVFGGHYLVDLLAGSLVMVVLVLVWHQPRPWRN